MSETSEQKYYWMAYEVKSSHGSCVYGIATSRHPLSAILELRSPPPTTLPSSLAMHVPCEFHNLISWQEISLEEYEVARQNCMADKAPDQPSPNPYR